MTSLESMRIPPHSIEAEQSVLGGLLLDHIAIDRIGDVISDADFFRDDHRRIYRHIALIAASGSPVDVVTVAESISDAGENEQTGGLAYLGDLAANTPGARNIRYHAERVKEKSVLRSIQEVAARLHESCANPNGRTVEQLIAEAEAAMMGSVDRSGSEPKSLAEVFQETLTQIDERSQRGGNPVVLQTGIAGLDHLKGGLEPGELGIIAGRPSMGKTAVGCAVADHVVRQGKSVLFFTLEMSAKDIGARLLSSRTRVSVHAMRRGTTDQEHWRRMSDQLGKASKQRMFIDDKAAIGVPYVRAKARRLQRQYGLDLVVIDYLQLMKGSGDNRTQEIGSISRGLKALAKELAVPIIALAQINRAVDGRTDKRPMMSDLRDSGELEQDADFIVMIHRESVYRPLPEWDGIAELLVRKNRNGPTGDVILRYIPEVMSFENYDGPDLRQQSGSPSNSMRDAARHQQRARGIPD